jgi:hypothetical protein
MENQQTQIEEELKQQPPFAYMNYIRMNDEIKKNIEDRLETLYTKENMDNAIHQ